MTTGVDFEIYDDTGRRLAVDDAVRGLGAGVRGTVLDIDVFDQDATSDEVAGYVDVLWDDAAWADILPLYRAPGDVFVCHDVVRSFN